MLGVGVHLHETPRSFQGVLVVKIPIELVDGILTRHRREQKGFTAHTGAFTDVPGELVELVEGYLARMALLLLLLLLLLTISEQAGGDDAH